MTFIQYIVILSAVLVQSLPSAPTRAAQGPKHTGVITLQLECASSGHIRFLIANDGSTDTTASLGTVIGNRSKYLFDHLELTVKGHDQSIALYQYRPYSYPAAIGGTLAEWLQPIPAGSTLAIVATAHDFLSHTRLQRFPSGAELRLTLTVPEPQRQSMLLAYWRGVLSSNSCAT